jgi:methionine-rich copper-binding protein CopC
MKTMRPILIALFSLAGFTLAQAHAFLDHAQPRVGSSGPSPEQVELWMTEDLEPAFTKVQVFDAQNHEVDNKDAKIAGATMTVSLPKLGPGIYKVKWSAVAVDTHHTTGTFSFTVR